MELDLKRTASALTIFGAAVLLTCPSAADLRTFGYRWEWTPNGCYEPSPPILMFSRSNPDLDIEAYNRFITSAQNFIDCMKQQGADDLKKAKIAIEDGIRQKSDEMLSAARSAKQQLEMIYGTLR